MKQPSYSCLDLTTSIESLRSLIVSLENKFLGDAKNS